MQGENDLPSSKKQKSDERYAVVKIDAKAFALASEMAELLDYSGKQVVEKCIAAIHAMQNQKTAERFVPLIVKQLDTAKEHKRKEQLLAPPSSASPSDLAQDPVKKLVGLAAKSDDQTTQRAIQKKKSEASKGG